MLKVPKTTGLRYICNKYVKENVKDEIDFLPADTTILLPADTTQRGTTILAVYGQACPYYPK